MTDIEYEILDELYFVNTFENLLKEIDIDESALLKELGQLISKEWVKCFINNNTEVKNDRVDLLNNRYKHLFLATKKGLMAHNAGI